MKKIYVEKEALELKGKEYFKSMDPADFWNIKEGLQDDGLYVYMDDNGDYSIRTNVDPDGVYTDIEDL